MIPVMNVITIVNCVIRCTVLVVRDNAVTRMSCSECDSQCINQNVLICHVNKCVHNSRIWCDIRCYVVSVGEIAVIEMSCNVLY